MRSTNPLDGNGEQKDGGTMEGPPSIQKLVADRHAVTVTTDGRRPRDC